ncbi:MAG TPA: CPBP family glutamic-type intramembrane protease [Thermoanaerobaculia bacterium]|nr:CPBP family glutamic-type intramembrane protease [Thermoanaerobaculia bacterium]
MNRAWWIYVLGVIATLLSFPYPPNFLALLVAELLVVLLIWAGLWFGAKHGLGSSIPSLRRAALSLVIGALSGAVVLALLPLGGLQSRIIKEATIPVWKWLIIAFDSATLEEIIFRLFLVSFVVWLLNVATAALSGRGAAEGSGTHIRIAIIIAALLFGAAHLNRWLSAGPIAITAVMLVNGLIAVVLGLLYVRWGIEAAILGHFAGDIVVHILGPRFFA